MSIMMNEAEKLKVDVQSITKAYQDLKEQHSELVAAFILAVKALGGSFIIDQTDKETFEYVSAIMREEIGFQITGLDKEKKVFKFTLVEESAQEGKEHESEPTILEPESENVE